ncbi:UNVERIFIED_CONTAM: hypothetical protein GTU68_054600 [Idotea baltica]|nr:hypothetical protein [Idotea baltica]
MSEKKDLIVLGSGPGGYIAAIRATQLGRKVSIIEREALGGVCLNWGCIPSKALLRSAQLCHDMQHADEFGFEVDDFKIDFPKVIGRSRSVASKLSGGVNYLMKKNKIEIISDCCLLSIGVVPNTEEIGLEEVGIKTERGFIETDGYLRTNVPNHFAIGDCAGGILLAHKASHEGIIAAETACGQANGPMHYDNIASCTYCQPQVASVGLTERALKEKGIKYKVGKIPFQAIGKAIAIGEPEGMIKVLISEEVGEVLGVHIVHAEATELITEAAIIRSHEGIAASVVDTIHPHPTLSEAMSEAMALALGRPLNY